MGKKNLDQLISITEGMSKEDALSMLWENSLLNVTSVNAFTVCDWINKNKHKYKSRHHKSLPFSIVEAMHAAAEHFCTTYENVRKYWYYYRSNWFSNSENGR